MLVNNRQTHPIGFAGANGLVTLVPGWNEMSDVDALAFRAAIKPLKYEAKNLIEFGEVSEPKQAGAKPVGKTLAQLTPEVAEATINETNDIALLEAWKKREKREDVRLAIANRIEEVKNYKPGEGDSDENGPKSEDEE